MLTKLLGVTLLLLASQASFSASATISQALQHEARTEANKLRDAVRKGVYSDVQMKVKGDLAKLPFTNPITLRSSKNCALLLLRK